VTLGPLKEVGHLKHTLDVSDGSVNKKVKAVTLDFKEFDPVSIGLSPDFCLTNFSALKG